jgi:hypothetical protein
LGRIPIGFALWHKQSKSLNELTLAGLSLLRNRYPLKPEAVLADGAFSTDKLFKRLEDYGWPTVMCFRSNRKLGDGRISQQINRWVWSYSGAFKKRSQSENLSPKKPLLCMQ